MEKWNHLVILRPTRGEMLTEGPTEWEAEVIGRHFHYYQELVEEGLALLVGRTQENSSATIGLAIITASDLGEAHELARNDPAVIECVMSAEVRPYKVALFGG